VGKELKGKRREYVTTVKQMRTKTERGMTKKKKFFEGQGSRLLPRPTSAYRCSTYNWKLVRTRKKRKKSLLGNVENM
jgi:hypothetical protein